MTLIRMQVWFAWKIFLKGVPGILRTVRAVIQVKPFSNSSSCKNESRTVIVALLFLINSSQHRVYPCLRENVR